MPPKANSFNFELTCLICLEKFRNQTDIKNHGCRKFSIKCGCCLNTFTVRNELAEHLNQKGIYLREPMIPPTTTDPAEQNTDTLDDLEQILQSVNIPTVLTMVEISQPQIPLTVAQSNLDSLDASATEEVEILSMPLIESVVKDQISETPAITEQNTETVKSLPTTSRGKDIQNLREQYSSPEPISWTCESSSVEPTPSSSRTSYFPHSSTSLFNTSDTEPTSSSHNRSRSRSPRPAAAEQEKAQIPFQLDELTDHFEWQLLHGRVRVGLATDQEVDRFVYLDQSLRSQLEGIVNDPADMSHEELLDYFHSLYNVMMTKARAKRPDRCPPEGEGSTG